MGDRLWSDTQLMAGFSMFSMVQATGQCQGMHPFSSLTAFVSCTMQLGVLLNIEGSLRLFHENLCHKMGYDYAQLVLGAEEEACREVEN